MSIPEQETKTIYNLTDANLGPFSTVFWYETDVNLQVLLELAADAGFTVLTEGPDYTATAPTPLTTGGEVVLTSDYLVAGAWPDGSRLLLQRVTTVDQPSTYGHMLGFSPGSSEDAIDHVDRQVQELHKLVERVIDAPPAGIQTVIYNDDGVMDLVPGSPGGPGTVAFKFVGGD